MTFIRHCLLWSCLFALLLPFGAAADALDPEGAVSVSGFGTAGLTHNSTGGAEFIRDISQPRGIANGWSAKVDSVFGLQLNARFSADVDGVVQVVSHYNYQGNYDPDVTWAFISYSPTPDWKLRVGRLGWDVYMLSDSRYVGYSYLWVRPPVDYFGPLQLSHIDGADAVVELVLGSGLASAKFYGGRADEKLPSPGGDAFDLSGSRVLGVNLDYLKGDWHARAGYTAIRIDNEVPSISPLLDALRGTGSPIAGALASDLALAGKTATIASAGVIYEHGPWQAQLMYNRSNSNSLLFPPKDAGYVLLSYRTGEWTPYVTLAGTRSKAVNRQTGFPTPNPLDDAVSNLLKQAQSRQRTATIGVRYDFMRNADLKIQLDQVRVQDHAALLWRNAQPDWNGRATIFSVALDFVF
ncbi:MAG: hypothetical protein ABI569_03625 [Casimicrobiaceae bacterium]